MLRGEGGGRVATATSFVETGFKFSSHNLQILDLFFTSGSEVKPIASDLA